MKQKICPKCINMMNLVEAYKRGRRFWTVYECIICGFIRIKKGKLVPNNVSIHIIRRGCSVPWGKDRHSRVNPKKKKRKK